MPMSNEELMACEIVLHCAARLVLAVLLVVQVRIHGVVRVVILLPPCHKLIERDLAVAIGVEPVEDQPEFVGFKLQLSAR